MHPDNNSPLIEEKGFAVIEFLVSTIIISVVSLGMLHSTLSSMKISKKSHYDSTAYQLAVERLEDYSVINPQTLDNGDDTSETGISRNNMEFTRTTDVTINTNGSRTVNVVVTSVNGLLDSSVTLSNSFPLWGER